jgi:hypothetical protein
VWTGQLDAVHCYDSIVVLDKRTRFAPFAEQVGHAEFLNYPRSAAGVFSELLATRDAAIAERDAVRAQLPDTDRAAALEEELRQVRAELAGIRPTAALLSARLNQAKTDLDASRTMVRDLRRSATSRLGRLRRGSER